MKHLVSGIRSVLFPCRRKPWHGNPANTMNSFPAYGSKTLSWIFVMFPFTSSPSHLLYGNTFRTYSQKRFCSHRTLRLLRLQPPFQVCRRLHPRRGLLRAVQRAVQFAGEEDPEQAFQDVPDNPSSERMSGPFECRYTLACFRVCVTTKLFKSIRFLFNAAESCARPSGSSFHVHASYAPPSLSASPVQPSSHAQPLPLTILLRIP